MSLASEPFDLVNSSAPSLVHIRQRGGEGHNVQPCLASSAPWERSMSAIPCAYKQVLMNLLSNALKFAPERAGSNSTSRQSKKSGIGNSYGSSISDNGIGMSKSFQERMFQPFEQEMTDQRGLSGSGLGLAIVRSFVQLMDGTIRVESEQGKGASFFRGHTARGCSKGGAVRMG
mgnify:CR=1 FL=1